MTDVNSLPASSLRGGWREEDDRSTEMTGPKGKRGGAESTKQTVLSILSSPDWLTNESLSP